MAKIKPNTPHPTRRGMVMGVNGRYVSRSTYNKQTNAKPPSTKSAQSTTDAMIDSYKKSKKRAQTQTKSTPKPSTNNNKSVSGPPRGAQGPASPPVQGPNKKVSGIIGTRKGSTTAPTTPPPTPGTTKFNKFSAKTVASTATLLSPRSDLPAKLVAGGSLAAELISHLRGNPKATAESKPKPKPKTKSSPSESVGKYNTKDKDGTVRSRKKVGPKKVGPKKLGTIAQAFDKAFAAARKAGKKEFTWKGKRYTTKLA